MARISKADHARILELIDGQHRSAAEVAAEYGCTRANIYALLARLRRTSQPHTKVEPSALGLLDDVILPSCEDPPSRLAALAPVGQDHVHGDHAMEPAAASQARRLPASDDDARGLALTGHAPPQLAVAPRQPLDRPETRQSDPVVTPMTRRETTKKGAGIGAALAKPGVALMMRTADGEENLTPFRSLDDLLAAVKPILRAAARSSDAVWFSIQPVDLASLDSDAA